MIYLWLVPAQWFRLSQGKLWNEMLWQMEWNGFHSLPVCDFILASQQFHSLPASNFTPCYCDMLWQKCDMSSQDILLIYHIIPWQWYSFLAIVTHCHTCVTVSHTFVTASHKGLLCFCITLCNWNSEEFFKSKFGPMACFCGDRWEFKFFQVEEREKYKNMGGIL